MDKLQREIRRCSSEVESLSYLLALLQYDDIINPHTYRNLRRTYIKTARILKVLRNEYQMEYN